MTRLNPRRTSAWQMPRIQFDTRVCPQRPTRESRPGLIVTSSAAWEVAARRVKVVAIGVDREAQPGATRMGDILVTPNLRLARAGSDP
jgi:hypothetical protein